MFHDKLHDEHSKILEAIGELKYSVLLERQLALEHKLDYLIRQLGGDPDAAVMPGDKILAQTKGHDEHGRRKK